MAMFSKENYLKLIFESGLIIFSVMLALFLDEYRVNLKEEAATQKALSNVQQEMMANLAVLESWHVYHSKVFENIDAALKLETLPVADFVKDGEELQYYSLMPKGIVQGLLDDSAWQAFRSTESFSNLEFETILALSKVYKTQASGVQSSLNLILKEFSGSDFLEIDKLRDNLLFLRRAFREIASQEAYLINEYRVALKYLGNRAK